MRIRALLETTVAAGAGYVATKALDRSSSAIYARQSDASRSREEELRDELPTIAFVRKTAALSGMTLDDEQERRLSRVVHFGVGAGGGVAAYVLSKTTPLGPFASGLATGLVIFALVDEGANYVLGLTAPATAWPAESHVRGLIAHLVYGGVIGALLAVTDRGLRRA